MSTRRICVFTGTRADYGLIRGLAHALDNDPRAELVLLVSGTHLSETHGGTESEVTRDGLRVAARVPIWSGGDTAAQTGQDVGAAVAAYTVELDEMRPATVVVLGDRLEALALATAATVLSIPVVHIHGGEITEGAMDDSLRHAITKLSYLHLVTTEEHRARVIQMGEEPTRVHSLGAPIVDALMDLELLSSEEVSNRFEVHIARPTALVTFHPAVMDVIEPQKLVGEMLLAFDRIPELHVIITGTNSDIGSTGVRDVIADYASRNPDRVDYIESFGQLGYLSAMAESSVVVGNSSSVVLEAPVLGVPSVLIGDRQKGRPQSASVLAPAPNAEAIENAIREALTPDFAGRAARRETPFGSPGFAERAAAAILSTELPIPPRKRFYDLTGEIRDL